MKNRKIINVLDCELTCFEKNIVPAGQTREIIEFGVSYVDLRTLEILDSYSLPVVPVMSEVSDYCTQLTGWTYADLKKRGTTFKEACRRLMAKHATRNRLVVVDSCTELVTIRDQCQLMGVDFPFGDASLNVSAMYTMAAMPGRLLSLKEQLERLGMSFEGLEHRGANDSYNLANLFVRLMQLLRGALPALPGTPPSPTE